MQGLELWANNAGGIMSKCLKSQRGFTLVELLTVVAIIGVLATLSLQSFTVYKANAYYAQVQQTSRNARVSLEAGINNPNLPTGAMLSTYSDTPGRVTNGDGILLTPALINSRDSYVYVTYDPSCADSSCIESYIYAKSCRLKEARAWYRYGTGLEITLDHIDSGVPC
jgi:prepilin-type N-terminal cleavage/methylation domain-containing protein